MIQAPDGCTIRGLCLQSKASGRMTGRLVFTLPNNAGENPPSAYGNHPAAYNEKTRAFSQRVECGEIVGAVGAAHCGRPGQAHRPAHT